MWQKLWCVIQSVLPSGWRTGSPAAGALLADHPQLLALSRGDLNEENCLTLSHIFLGWVPSHDWWCRGIKACTSFPNLGQLWKPIPSSECSVGSAEVSMRTWHLRLHNLALFPSLLFHGCWSPKRPLLNFLHASSMSESASRRSQPVTGASPAPPPHFLLTRSPSSLPPLLLPLLTSSWAVPAAGPGASWGNKRLGWH